MTISSVIEKLKKKQDLDRNDLKIIFDNFKDRNIPDNEIKDLVLCWREKGETAFELKTLADILYENSPPCPLFSTPIIDVCGTGGDKANTFNISTLAAIVASASGVNIIKHSGRSTTSISGSVDVLNEFDFDFNMPKEIMEKSLEQTHLMFVSSDIFREIFGRVKIICKELGMPGFVNLLGPLTNPYKTTCQLLGVSNIKWGKLMSAVLKLQNKTEALVVCSEIINKNAFLDELSFCGQNHIWHLNNGVIEEIKLSPEDFNHETVLLDEIVITKKDDSKAVFKNILLGNIKTKDMQAKADIVALNAGGALYLAKKVKTIKEGYKLALNNIMSGNVWEHFQNFLNCNKMRS